MAKKAKKAVKGKKKVAATKKTTKKTAAKKSAKRTAARRAPAKAPARKAKPVERFKIVNGGEGLEVKVHVEDPGAFTTPWNAVQRYRRDQREQEVPLHEMGPIAKSSWTSSSETCCLSSCTNSVTRR
jgi:hypothetical protein